MADNNTIARPYARAIFEVAQANNALSELSESLQAASELMSDGQVASFLSTPTLTDAKRFEFLTGLFTKVLGPDSVFAGSDKHGSNFLKLLLEYGRIDVLPEIAEHFEKLKADAENMVDVTVTSATEMSAAEEQEFSEALKKRLGRKIHLETKVDESLIGGAVVRAGDVVIDGSLRARLDSLTNSLIK